MTRLPKIKVPHLKGEIVHIEKHPSGKFVTLHVRHGKKPKAPKEPKGMGAMDGGGDPFDDRAESKVMAPMADASQYHIGQQVGIGVAPAPDGGDDSDGSDVEDSPLEAKDAMVKDIMSGKRHRQDA